MAKKIVVQDELWQSQDGHTWETEEEADRHDLYKSLESVVERFFHFDMTSRDITESLVDNAEELKRVLNDYC